MKSNYYSAKVEWLTKYVNDLNNSFYSVEQGLKNDFSEDRIKIFFIKNDFHIF